MHFFFSRDPEAPGRLRVAATVVAMLCLAFFTSCSLDGATKKDVATATPQGSSAPPTGGLPLPPIAKSGSGGGEAARGWTLLDGRRASFSDHRGQVLVLDFYATYCPPCREEIPHLIALQRRYGPAGLRIVGLNVGDGADRVKVPGFVKELGIDYPLGNPDPALVELFLADNTAIPQTYVFDRNGKFIKRFIGYDSTMPAELERLIQTALSDEVKSE